MGATAYPVFTVGHSNHPPETFMGLLKRHDVHEVVDVRSSPYSRYTAHFNREVLEDLLGGANIGYEWLGGILGGRPADMSCYDAHGQVLYDQVAQRDWFDDGIRTVVRHADERRIALMCAEKDPLDCHRTLLVAKALADQDIDVQHILDAGSLESHDEAMDRLLGIFKLSTEGDWFSTREDFIADAVARQAKKKAYAGQKASADYDSTGAF